MTKMQDTNNNSIHLIPEKLKTLWLYFTQCKVPAFIVSQTNEIVDCNEAFEEMTGFSDSDMPDIETLIRRLLPDRESQSYGDTVSSDMLNNLKGIHKQTFKISGKDGSERKILLSADQLGITNGESGYRIVLGSDLTENKFGLHDDNGYSSSLQRIFDATPSPLFIRDFSGKYLSCNRAFEKFFGVSRKDIVGKTVIESAILKLSEMHAAKEIEFLQNEGVLRFRSSIKSTNGIIQDVTLCYTTYSDALGKPEGLIGEIHKESEKVNVQKVSDYIAKDKNVIFDNLTELVVYYDTDMHMQWVNKAAADTIGCEKEDLINLHCYEIWHQRQQACENCPVIKALETGEIHESKMETPDGKTWLVRGYPVYGENNEIAGGVEFTREITDLRNAENCLRENERMLRSFLEQSHEGIILIDEQGKVIEWNQAMEMFTGLNLDEISSKSIFDIFEKICPDTDRKDRHIENLRNKYYKCLLKPNAQWPNKSFELDIKNLRGECRTLLLTPFPISLGNSRLTGTIIHDITERKKSEDRIRNHLVIEDALSQVSALFVSSDPDIAQILRIMGETVNVSCAHIFEFRSNGRLMNKTYEWSATDGNPNSMQEMELETDKFKWFMQTLNNKDCIVVDDVDDLPDDVEAEREWFRGRNVKSQLNVSIHSTSGELIGFMGFCDREKPRKWSINEVKFLRVISEMLSTYMNRKKSDIELKKLEEQLYQAQKMESIGRLAGGLAHDFNNIITAIMGYAEMMKIRFPRIETLEGQASDIIFKNAERARGLTQELLSFARRGRCNTVPLNINTIIRETVKVSSKIFDKKIEPVFELDRNIKYIEADKVQLEQVLTNLIINSRDAMPDGGYITFKTSLEHLDENFTSCIPDIASGEHVKLSVIDTGIGIPPDIKKHIFEPFFTTKEEGVGTGLGLATVYGIVRKHRGHIIVESEPGCGTTFSIYLPVCKDCQDEQNKLEENIITGSKTILMVDDEDDVRTLGKLMLSSMGYNVILASDGREAIDIYKGNAEEIDLILLDIIMPNMAGSEAFRELKKINPGVKVLLLSGYGKNDSVSKILDEGASGFLQKPFNRSELSRFIAETLDDNE